MEESNAIQLATFKSWKTRNLGESLIKEELLSKGYSEDQIHEIVDLYKKKCQKERLLNGSILIVLGSVLGFISVVFTLLNHESAWRELLMYGLTISGVLIAFVGLYLVFERA